MRRILVTGANKGIGLAVVEAILRREQDTFVYLGARDLARGEAAAASLAERERAFADRLAVLEIDVASDASVRAAAARLAGVTLYAIVNNAAVGVGSGTLAQIVDTNILGVRRVCEAFLPLLVADGGRIVNVSSASGPMFVAGCSPERQRELTDDRITWPRIQAILDECVELERAGDAAAFSARGLGDGAAYGLSKALLNGYTMLLAREHPKLVVNACTPGFIATDLTKPYLDASGQTAEQLGMKPPSEGAKAPVHLLFAELPGNGRFYGSDAKRSPLDKYRSPGSPEYSP